MLIIPTKSKKFKKVGTLKEKYRLMAMIHQSKPYLTS